VLDRKERVIYTAGIKNLSPVHYVLPALAGLYRGSKKEHMITIPSILDMLKAGVHFGHQTSRWHPKMGQFIFTQRHGVHIINLEKTRAQLDTVLKEVQAMAASGKRILFVSTKPQAKEMVKKASVDCGMPYLVDRWIGGMLTNFAEISKLIKSYNELKEKQQSGELEKYTKKERLDIARKLEKMDAYVAGISTLDQMPDAVFLPAMQREKTAVTEANKTGVIVIGVCDTNANPDKAQHVIPANDDAVKSIGMIVDLVSQAISAGAKEWEAKKTIDKKDAPASDIKEKAPTVVADQ
jgi:small subunit ribosomal protein S2